MSSGINYDKDGVISQKKVVPNSKEAFRLLCWKQQPVLLIITEDRTSASFILFAPVSGKCIPPVTEVSSF
jgi:hypothetical protein